MHVYLHEYDTWVTSGLRKCVVINYEHASICNVDGIVAHNENNSRVAFYHE